MHITTPRIAVLGDIGGYRKPFYGMLKRLGVKTSTNHIPDGLTILQLGDLIGSAPEPSAHILNTVLALRQNNPGQWIQLIGNWEARYHPHGIYFNARRQRDMSDLDNAHQALLNTLWDEPNTGAAAVLESDNLQPTLITHAGVTRHFLRLLGLTNEDNPHNVAAAINEAMHNPKARHLVFAPGIMYGGSVDNPTPGPLWASPEELWTSWNRHPLPFDQIVGHAVPYMFNKERWYLDNPIPETQWAKPHPPKRMTYWRPPHSDHGIAHIDPAIWHGSPAEHLPAHLFPDATAATPGQRTSLPAIRTTLDGRPVPNVAVLIEQLLHQRALAPHELATGSGIEHERIISYRNGEETPSLDNLQRLARATGSTLTISIDRQAVGHRY